MSKTAVQSSLKAAYVKKPAFGKEGGHAQTKKMQKGLLPAQGGCFYSGWVSGGKAWGGDDGG